MLAKINFPVEALILSSLGMVLYSFFLSLFPLAVVMLFYGVSVKWTLVLVPFALLPVIGLGTAIGLFLLPLGNLYSDVERILGFVIQFWFLATPVVYPPVKGGLWVSINRLNPVTPLLITVKELVTEGVVSDPTGFAVVSGFTVLFLFITWVIFRISVPILIERMSA